MEITDEADPRIFRTYFQHQMVHLSLFIKNRDIIYNMQIGHEIKRDNDQLEIKRLNINKVL